MSFSEEVPGGVISTIHDNGKEAIRIKLAEKRRRADCKRNKQVKHDHHHNGESTKAVDGADLVRAAFCSVAEPGGCNNKSMIPALPGRYITVNGASIDSLRVAPDDA